MKNVSLKTQINQIKGYVYYYRIPSVFTFEKIIPHERQSEIDLTNNQENKSEKYFVWRLLEWVFLNVYQKKMEDIIRPNDETQTSATEEKCIFRTAIEKYINLLRYYRNCYFYALSGEITYLDIKNELKNKIF